MEAVCDYCGSREVEGCIGGTHYYCRHHEDEVVAIHDKDMEEIP